MFDFFKNKAESDRSNNVSAVSEQKFKAVSLKKENKDMDIAYLTHKQQVLIGCKNKLYTKREIIQLGQVMGIDAEEAFEWMEEPTV